IVEPFIPPSPPHDLPGAPRSPRAGRRGRSGFACRVGCRAGEHPTAGRRVESIPKPFRLRHHVEVTEPAPYIDFANLPAPTEGIVMTLFITVRKVARSRDFYSRVLGGTVVLDQNPCVVKLSNSWIIMNPGGPAHAGHARYLGGRLPAGCHDIDLHEPAGRRHPRLL